MATAKFERNTQERPDLSTQRKKTIDATGLFCPGPQRVLEVFLRHTEKGTLIEFLADDPDAKKDIKELCEITGDTLISVEEKEGTITFLIRRG